MEWIWIGFLMAIGLTLGGWLLYVGAFLVVGAAALVWAAVSAIATLLWRAVRSIFRR